MLPCFLPPQERSRVLRRIGGGAKPCRNMARAPSDSPLPCPKPDFTEEAGAIARGLWPVAGLDEAGRGPLAGPVVAAAVILDPSNLPEGLDDSKRLSAAERERLFALILQTSLAVSVSSASAETIDRINILRASLGAMCRALDGLTLAPKLALVDGQDVPPGLSCPGHAIIRGDQRSQSVAAASIVAKVMRDRMMECCGSHHAAFAFERHKGYGTARHQTALQAHGPITRLHRLSFAPVRSQAALLAGE